MKDCFSLQKEIMKTWSCQVTTKEISTDESKQKMKLKILTTVASPSIMEFMKMIFIEIAPTKVAMNISLGQARLF